MDFNIFMILKLNYSDKLQINDQNYWIATKKSCFFIYFSNLIFILRFNKY